MCVTYWSVRPSGFQLLLAGLPMRRFSMAIVTQTAVGVEGLCVRIRRNAGRGNTIAAIYQVKAFIGQPQGLWKAGQLPGAKAQDLTVAAERAIELTTDPAEPMRNSARDALFAAGHEAASGCFDFIPADHDIEFAGANACNKLLSIDHFFGGGELQIKHNAPAGNWQSLSAVGFSWHNPDLRGCLQVVPDGVAAKLCGQDVVHGVRAKGVPEVLRQEVEYQVEVPVAVYVAQRGVDGSDRHAVDLE